MTAPANDPGIGRRISEPSDCAPFTFASAEDDPIHGLIRKCREARAEERAVLAELSKAEARVFALPPGTRLRELASTAVGEWEKAEGIAHNRTDRALRELVTATRPTTFAGAVALLRFAVSEEVAESIPESIGASRNGEEWSFSWHELAIESALPIIEAALRDREAVAQ